ncbi:MAG: lactate racemase domain-containing protein, partial [Paeniclostridium sordellii]|nr:lactate racemase domain-containing protein [Paeniclostridium sordellii]
MEIKLPYSKSGMYVNIPDKNMIKVLQSKTHDFKTTLSESEIVKKALENPIESETLEELVKDKKDVVIITSDHTRPVPSRITLPIILNKIRNSNPDIDIKIIISTGCHRPSTREELIYKMGEEIVDKENIIMHFANDEESMVKVGKLPSGGDLIVNKAIMETDLLIAEGFIEPHFFAGFSGGRKSVLPG